MNEDIAELNKLVADREDLTHLLTRFLAIKHQNFSLKDRDPIERFLVKSLADNLNELQKFALKVKVE